jgi:hypothetical protein
LIILGVYLLYSRVAGMSAHAGGSTANPREEVQHDHR